MSARRYSDVPFYAELRTPSVYPSSFAIDGAKKVIVELGPGRGDFLFHLAATNPDATVIGIEIKRKRVDKIIMGIERRGLSNLLMIHDDARTALPRFFADSTVDEIHINFPDPWPKSRHEKNRMLTDGLLAECARALKCGGTVSIATDQAAYAKDAAEAASKVASLKSSYEEVTKTDMDGTFPTLFETKWKKEGRKITYQKYVKTC